MTDQHTAAAAARAFDAGVNVEDEIADALYLLDYAVANGVKTADGHPLSQDIVTTVKGAAEKIGLLADGTHLTTLSAVDWGGVRDGLLRPRHRPRTGHRRDASQHANRALRAALLVAAHPPSATPLRSH